MHPNRSARQAQVVLCHMGLGSSGQEADMHGQAIEMSASWTQRVNKDDHVYNRSGEAELWAGSSTRVPGNLSGT
jgi:hypothetical protein